MPVANPAIADWGSPGGIGATTPSTVKGSTLAGANLTEDYIPRAGANGVIGNSVWRIDQYGSISYPGSTGIGFTGNCAGFLWELRNTGSSFNRQGFNIVAGNNSGSTQFLQFTSVDRSVSEAFSMTAGAVSLNNAFSATGNLTSSAVVRTGSYTVATVPSASANPGGLIYVSNESGGGTTAFSDGTSWRRIHDRAIIS